MKRKVSLSMLVVAVFSIWAGANGVDRIVDAYQHAGVGWVSKPVPGTGYSHPINGEPPDTRPEFVSENEYRRHEYGQARLWILLASVGGIVLFTCARRSERSFRTG